MKFQSHTPIFRSFNEEKARAFYLDFLGFEVEFEHRFDPAAPLYLGLRQGECTLHISEHFGDSAPGSTLRIEVEDVIALCETLNNKAYKHSRPGVQHQSWGTIEMSISDPSGNKLIFYTNAPNT